MYVCCGKYLATGSMLRLYQFFSEIWPVVVVNDSERSHHYFVFVDLLGDQVFADQVTNGFRAVDVSLFADQAVKLTEQWVLQRNTDSSQISRSNPPNWRYLIISQSISC